MEILLTNDDGIDSMALLPTLKELSKVGNVNCVVPAKEQSWKGKSITRRVKKIEKKQIKIEKYDVITLDALPADCANYGIYNLENKPDLVISGANLGHNLGISNFYSSGTIGAALEGHFSGIKSIAISVPYESGEKLKAEGFENSLFGISELCDKFYNNKNDDFRFCNLNIPYNLGTKKYIATEMPRYHYGQLFIDKNELVKPKRYEKLSYPKKHIYSENTDVGAINKKWVSINIFDDDLKPVGLNVLNNWIAKEKLGIL
jgi:5'/3'-nucleotidase SurE